MVTHHGLAQTGDYDAVCDCIQRSYAPLGSELEWQLKVRTRVQKVGESLMEFCGALRGMADKAFPAWPAEQLQDLAAAQSVYSGSPFFVDATSANERRAKNLGRCVEISL